MLRNKTNILGSVSHDPCVRRYIRRLKNVRTIGVLSIFSLLVLASLSIFPIINHEDQAEATAGVAEVPTLAMVVGKEKASVDLTPVNKNGTFVSSETTDEASFNVTTSNYTGYTLTISAADDNGRLTNLNTADVLDTITTVTDATTFATGASSTYINKWGFRPSKLNSLQNTDFIPSPTTTPTTLDITTSANPTANNYTIGLGARVDYTKPAGTYTNTYVLTATANPVAYHIEYYDLAGISSTTLNDSGIIWNDPTSGAAKEATYEKIADQGSSTNTGATITINPTYVSGHSTPTRHTYTFAGWCRNSTDHTKISVNNIVTAIQNSSNKVTAYHNPGTMCNGVVPDYNTSTDNFIKAGDANFKLDPTKDNTNIKLYAVWKPTTFASAGIAANANMQSMTNAICKATTPNQFTTLKDARGSSASAYVYYVVIKLLDGNCWMADNLDLDVYAYRSYLTTSNTHADATALNYFKNGGNASTTNRYPTGAINSINNVTYTDPSPVSHTTQDWDTSDSYTVPLANRHGTCLSDTEYACLGMYDKSSYTHTTVIKYLEGDATKPYDIGVGGYKIGTYYNMCAASAGFYCFDESLAAGNSTYDICPAGWRMPTGGPSGEYQNLYNKITSITTTPSSFTNPISFQTMLSILLSGGYHHSSTFLLGSYGQYWGSTLSNNDNMYSMASISTTLALQSALKRSYGRSVRCLAQ